MKIVRFCADGSTSYGILEEDGGIRQLAGCPFDSLEESGETTHLDQRERAGAGWHARG